MARLLLMLSIPKILRGLATALIFFAYFKHSHVCFGQRYEIGVGLGGLAYKGDLNPQFNPILVRPGIQAFFRYNFSMTVVGRINVLLGQLVGDGTLSPNLYMSSRVKSQFSTTLNEFSGIVEYNFFNFRNPKSRFIFGTPYLFGGPSVFIFNPSPQEKGGSVASIQPAINFGLGYKHQLGQYWNIGVEFGARATFTDFLDNVSDQNPSTHRQTGNKFDQDMYGFLGVNVSYTIKEIICPFDYQHQDSR